MQSGLLQLGADTNAAWPLHKGDGARAHLEQVNFNPPFPEPPIVLAFIAGLRTSNEADLRINVEPVNITANNFYIRIGTWRDSAVHGCDVSWIAVSASGAALAGQRVIMSRLAVRCKDMPSWRLDRGQGERNFKQQIKFNPPDTFSQVPLVFMGFSLLDIINEDDYRLNIAPVSVEKNGLELQISTWGETHVWSAHVSWMALDESYGRTQDIQVSVGRIPYKKTLPQYKLHEGHGARQVQQPVLFAKKFSHVPSVVPALCLIDILRDTPPRLRLRPAAITQNNAVMELSTMEKGHVWGASASWLAHAPAEKADAGGKKAKIQPAAANDAAAVPAAAAAAPAVAGVAVPAAAAPVLAAAAVIPAAATPAAAPLSPATSKKEKEDEDEATCKVCYDSKINTVIIPCGHMALCFDCSKLIKGPGKKNECPICKTKIKDIIKTYTT